MAFDDSFEHEVIHDGDEPRIILLLDFWHPDATPEIQDIASSQKRDDRTPAQKLTQRLQVLDLRFLANASPPVAEETAQTVNASQRPDGLAAWPVGLRPKAWPRGVGPRDSVVDLL